MDLLHYVLKGADSMRTNIARLIAALLVLCAPAWSRTTANWKEFHSADGGFAVLMPGEPEFESATTPTDLGPVEIHTVKCVADEYLCVVNYYDTSSVTDATRDKFLDDNCTGFVQGAGLLQKGDRRAVALGTNPGREVVAETQDGRAQLTARYYIVGKRVYLVMIGTSVDQASSPEVGRYFDSFHLLA
jgi:hypothetical protein